MSSGKASYLAAEERRRQFLELLSDGLPAVEACEKLGISASTYRAWRTKDHFFAAEADSRISGARRLKTADPHELTWENFIDYRWTFYGHKTPPHQAMIIRAMEDTRPGDITLILVPPEHGKVSPEYVDILRTRYIGGMNDLPATTGNGPEWTTMGELQVGDYVFGRDGKPTKVLGVYPQPVQPMRRVHFTDGTHLDVGLPHLWLVKDRNVETRVGGERTHPEFVCDTQHIEEHLTNSEGRPRFSVPMTAPLQFPEAVLPVDPWLLGYWLGNGSTGSGALTTHGDDAEYVRSRIAELGYEMSSADRPGKNAVSVYVSGMIPLLRQAGCLAEKHVPMAYQLASAAQRQELLAGLLDSDGYSGGAKGQVELSFTSERMASSVEAVIRSLGIKVKRIEGDASYKVDGEKKITGTRYRLIWTDHECRFTSPRKRAMFRPSTPQGDRLRWKYIERVEHLPDSAGVCIKVDAADHLYVSGRHLTVSHNTTIFEDWAGYKLSLNPEWRCMVGCEAQTLSVRILARIKNRMDPQGPFPKWVEQFGPFAPIRMSGQVNNQTWAATHFNVFKRTEFDERDYSMAALGFGSNIIGSRTDHLHCDDLQSKKTINKTDLMLETFVQDWLTRPGETGVTTINGTRAGDGDFYEGLMTMWDGEPFFRVVRLPAIVTDHATGTKRPLWEYDPTSKAKNKGYTMEMLEKIERKHGPDVWSRSYMQEPRSKGLGTFTEDIVDRCLDHQRVLWDDKLPAGEGSPVYIGLDPALGGINCISAWQITPDCIYLVDMQEDQHLQRNEDIMDRLEMVILRLRARGARITDVIVETMNFQRGLARDERFKDLGAKYGFAMREHLTNSNKYDEDIGVASMPSSFIQRMVNIPYAPEEHTRSVADALRLQLLRWRPGIKGSILRQDQVMSLWFVWIVWQSRRRSHPAAGSTFKARGLPWEPTNTGLLIPSSSSPFFGGSA